MSVLTLFSMFVGVSGGIVGWQWFQNESHGLFGYTDIELCSSIVIGIVFVCLLGIMYYLCIIPVNRVKHLHDVGYIHGIGTAHLTRKELAQQVMRRRKQGDVPPVYPNGWFCIVESRDLKIGEVKNVSCLGLTLAVFRDERGEVHALDAYCPHMGANFAVGGRVFGDCIECPFHGWKFSGHDGKCKHIPYAEKIPDIAKVKSWPVLERNCHVYLWYHAEDEEPSWFPPEIEEIKNGTWTYRGRTEHYVNAHIEEIPENGADMAHLPQVHSQCLFAGADLRYIFSKFWDFTRHSWENVSWTQSPPPNGHIGVLKLQHSLYIFGKAFPIPLVDLYMEAHQIGPGIVHMKFEHMFGKGTMFHHVTPVEPLIQCLRHDVYTSLPTFIARLIMCGEMAQIERDIMIWNNKQFMSKPTFVRCKEDELLAKHRRWYSQFYSEHSPQLQLSKDTLDW